MMMFPPQFLHEVGTPFLNVLWRICKGQLFSLSVAPERCDFDIERIQSPQESKHIIHSMTSQKSEDRFVFLDGSYFRFILNS